MITTYCKNHARAIWSHHNSQGAGGFFYLSRVRVFLFWWRNRFTKSGFDSPITRIRQRQGRTMEKEASRGTTGRDRYYFEPDFPTSRRLVCCMQPCTNKHRPGPCMEPHLDVHKCAQICTIAHSAAQMHKSAPVKRRPVDTGRRHPSHHSAAAQESCR